MIGYPMRPTSMPVGKTAQALLDDPDWVWQPKLDGRRRLVVCQGGNTAKQYNRHREEVHDIRAFVVTALALASPADTETIFDCELLPNGGLCVFDAPSHYGSFIERIGWLEDLILAGGLGNSDVWQSSCFGMNRNDKSLAHALRVAQRFAYSEGIVFKRQASHYIWGTTADSETTDWYKIKPGRDS